MSIEVQKIFFEKSLVECLACKKTNRGENKNRPYFRTYLTYEDTEQAVTWTLGDFCDSCTAELYVELGKQEL